MGADKRIREQWLSVYPLSWREEFLPGEGERRLSSGVRRVRARPEGDVNRHGVWLYVHGLLGNTRSVAGNENLLHIRQIVDAFLKHGDHGFIPLVAFAQGRMRGRRLSLQEVIRRYDGLGQRISVQRVVRGQAGCPSPVTAPQAAKLQQSWGRSLPLCYAKGMTKYLYIKKIRLFFVTPATIWANHYTIGRPPIPWV
jgi:hypothetical protein